MDHEAQALHDVVTAFTAAFKALAEALSDLDEGAQRRLNLHITDRFLGGFAKAPKPVIKSVTKAPAAPKEHWRTKQASAKREAEPQPQDEAATPLESAAWQ